MLTPMLGVIGAITDANVGGYNCPIWIISITIYLLNFLFLDYDSEVDIFVLYLLLSIFVQKFFRHTKLKRLPTPAF